LEMERHMTGRNPANKKENLRLLRTALRLTQKEFIERFLSSADKKPSMSIATYSNLESKDGVRMNEVIFAVSESLGIDSMLFSISPEEFAEKLPVLLSEDPTADSAGRGNTKKGSINHLVNRLTMYFAEQIFEKRLKKGDKIESDRSLASKLGVGRSAIREALKVLEVLGMIDIRPGQGTYISNHEASFFIVPLSWSLFLNGSQIDSIVEVRNLLEVKAAYLAAGCMDEENRGKLYEISHRLHKAYVERDFKEFLNQDLEFHICIAECSGNPVIYSMIQTISNLMRHVSGSGMVDEGQLRDIYEEHQKIYGLILAKDAKGASEAMKEHLEKSTGRYNYR
jgi:GntR family transcriptional repressor for pyruvate dehydrogenase complex